MQERVSSEKSESFPSHKKFDLKMICLSATKVFTDIVWGGILGSIVGVVYDGIPGLIIGASICGAVSGAKSACNVYVMCKKDFNNAERVVLISNIQQDLTLHNANANVQRQTNSKPIQIELGQLQDLQKNQLGKHIFNCESHDKQTRLPNFISEMFSTAKKFHDQQSMSTAKNDKASIP